MKSKTHGDIGAIIDQWEPVTGIELAALPAEEHVRAILENARIALEFARSADLSALDETQRQTCESVFENTRMVAYAVRPFALRLMMLRFIRNLW